MRRIVTLLLLVLAVAAAVPAGAVVDPIVITRDSATYYPGGTDHPIPLVVQAGDTLQYQNLDVFVAHNVWAVEVTEDGAPLFASSTMAQWNVSRGWAPVEVAGVDALAPGSYEFYCFIHPLMRGVLTIV